MKTFMSPFALLYIKKTEMLLLFKQFVCCKSAGVKIVFPDEQDHFLGDIGLPINLKTIVLHPDMTFSFLQYLECP